MSTTDSIKTQETTPHIEATPRPWRLGKVGDVGYSDAVAPCHIWTVKGPGYGMIATTAPWCQPYDQQRADAAFIVEAVNAYDANRELIEQLYAKLTCCCGSYVADHGMGDGHSPVAMYDYALQNAEERIEQLKAVQAPLVKAINAVTDASSDYLPPDGITKDEFINRVLGATDNAEIVAALKACAR